MVLAMLIVTDHTDNKIEQYHEYVCKCMIICEHDIFTII